MTTCGLIVYRALRDAVSGKYAEDEKVGPFGIRGAPTTIVYEKTIKGNGIEVIGPSGTMAGRMASHGVDHQSYGQW